MTIQFNTDNLPLSVLASSPAETVSSRYRFISTYDIVQELNQHGWYVKHASETPTRKEIYIGKQAHSLELMHRDFLPIRDLGDISPMILLRNGHNGKSRLSINIGIHRKVCANGLILPESFLSVSCTHTGNVKSLVAAALLQVKSTIPYVLGCAAKWNNLLVNDNQRMHYLTRIKNEGLLRDGLDLNLLDRPNRSYDQGNTLWLMYNRIQENLIKGQLPYVTTNNRSMHTREIRSISRKYDTNQKLWELTQITGYRIENGLDK